MRLAQPGNENIPIYLAVLGPNTLRYAGSVADGWLGTSFTPEHADAHLAYLREGAESAGRSLADIDIQAGGTVAFGDDIDALVGTAQGRHGVHPGGHGISPDELLQ